MPDQMADAIWGDHPPPSWSTQVQICVARLRKALGATAIDTASGGYRLTLSGDEVDIDRFEQLVAKGRASATAGDPERAVTAFSKALALWRGRPFDELDGWEPARNEAAVGGAAPQRRGGGSGHPAGDWGASRGGRCGRVAGRR